LLTQWNYFSLWLTAFEIPKGESPTRHDMLVRTRMILRCWNLP
jgi:hypothetical protein